MQPGDSAAASGAPEPQEGHDATVEDGDAVEHLWNAAYEMLRAMRTLLDAAEEFVESQRAERPSTRGSRSAGDGRLHHIDIDVRDDTGSNAGAS
jgi:hypothetical protein